MSCGTDDVWWTEYDDYISDEEQRRAKAALGKPMASAAPAPPGADDGGSGAGTFPHVRSALFCWSSQNVTWQVRQQVPVPVPVPVPVLEPQHSKTGPQAQPNPDSSQRSQRKRCHRRRTWSLCCLGAWETYLLGSSCRLEQVSAILPPPSSLP